MSKKLIGVVFGLLLGVMVLPQSAAALPPLQQKLSQSQISAIIALLQSFGAEQSVINNVSISLGGGTPGNSGSGVSCIELSYNLFSGSTDNTAGGQVTKLQRFLGVSQTGYFGPATEAAVQRWQAQNGVVSSGSPDSTGYGYVGSKTRAAMARGCGLNDEPYVTMPTIKILTPNGGESYNLARDPSMTLKWDATNVPYGATFVVEFQRQDGDRRQVSKMIADGVQRSYTIPSVGEFGDSSLHLVPGTYRVVMWIGNVGEPQSARDISDGTITITSSASNAPSATVDQQGQTVSTKGGSFSLSGTTENVSSGVIVFASTYDYGNVDYGVLNGQIGKDGIYKATASLANDGDWHTQFAWNVPGNNTFYVYVFDKTSTIQYGTEVHASLAPKAKVVVSGQNTGVPSMRILSPNGGESYRLDQPLTLTWSAENIPAGASFVVEFRRQGGGEVAKIATADSTARSVTFSNINKIRGGDLVTMDVGAYTVNMWALVNGTELAARDSSDGMINILQPAGSNPAATIDNSSLTQTRGNFYVNGSASNATSLQIIMVTGNYTGATDWNSANAAVRANSVYNVNSTARVENGRWVGVFGSGSGGAGVPVGTYTLLVYDLSNDGATPSVLPKLLTRNTLTVQY